MCMYTSTKMDVRDKITAHRIKSDKTQQHGGLFIPLFLVSPVIMAIVSNASVLSKYLSLDQRGSVQVEYVWIDGFNQLRSKTKTVNKVPSSAAELPEWNFDGSSTGQAEGHDSDVLIKPVAMFNDPFRSGDNKFVICETFNPDGTPHKTNHRHACNKIMQAHSDSQPWFGIEQEYMLIDPGTEKPYGWPKLGYPEPQVGLKRYLHVGVI